jgi:hypothetical protein
MPVFLICTQHSALLVGGTGTVTNDAALTKALRWRARVKFSSVKLND